LTYDRLAPGVLKELKKVIPKNESGRLKAAPSQGLTRNVGYPKLREHLGAVVAYMTMSKDYFDIGKLDTTVRASGANIDHRSRMKKDQDDGKGI
jgi:hypothetical protein